MADLLQTARGTRDILPEEQAYWQWVLGLYTEQVKRLGFQPIETPMYEYANVFTRGVGQTSDIVEKEMFEVHRHAKSTAQSDTEKEAMILRPEGTAAVVRAYIEHGMHTWSQPVRLYYSGPMFRYDRPQKGRYRQFYQIGLEYFGDNDPSADATVILACWQLLQSIGLTEGISFTLNSLGDETCRPKYRKKLKAYFDPYKDQLCADCQRRLATNPLRILDCKETACKAIAAGAPVILDELCKECKTHFGTLLEYLDEMGIPYNIDPHLVRGLDYYNRTAFEIVDTADSARQSSLGGGGRYDGLVKLYGGKETPAVGMAIGFDRLIEKLKERNITPPEHHSIRLVVVPLGDKAKKAGLRVLQLLNSWGIGTTGAFSKESLKSQLKYADKLRVPFAIIIGTREVFDKAVIIRDMKTGVQDTISLDLLEESIKDRLQQ